VKTIGLFYNNLAQRETFSQAVMSTKETSFPDSFFKENQYTSVVGMTTLKDSETYAEQESE
jgi:hypothetical protein